MQDRYAGDIGDFGKFQLLRFLFLQTSYSLKQIWYKYPDETHNNDGLYINYFDKVKDFDPLLEQALHAIVVKENRSINALQNAHLLPFMEYFEEMVNENNKDRLPFRKTWFTKAKKFALNSDIICVDPDNGIATKVHTSLEYKPIEILSWQSFNKKTKAGKYIFKEEIVALASVCKCLVVYHHLNRTMKHNEQIKRLKKELEKEAYGVLAIKHTPYSPRVYFFISCDKDFLTKMALQLQVFEKRYSVHWDFSSFQ